jgi:hypothetical protein
MLPSFHDRSDTNHRQGWLLQIAHAASKSHEYRRSNVRENLLHGGNGLWQLYVCCANYLRPPPSPPTPPHRRASFLDPQLNQRYHYLSLQRFAISPTLRLGNLIFRRSLRSHHAAKISQRTIPSRQPLTTTHPLMIHPSKPPTSSPTLTPPACSPPQLSTSTNPPHSPLPHSATAPQA